MSQNNDEGDLTPQHQHDPGSNGSSGAGDNTHYLPDIPLPQYAPVAAKPAEDDDDSDDEDDESPRVRHLFVGRALRVG